MLYGQDCICGQKNDCRRVSTAFALLKDPRRGYLRLPPYAAKPSNTKEHEMNEWRDACLWHLECSSTRQQHDACFVALHHFHPAVVFKHLKEGSPVPRTTSIADLKRLGIQGDCVRDYVNGQKEGTTLYFVPTYRLQHAKDDLKKLIVETSAGDTTTSEGSRFMVMQHHSTGIVVRGCTSTNHA